MLISGCFTVCITQVSLNFWGKRMCVQMYSHLLPILEQALHWWQQTLGFLYSGGDSPGACWLGRSIKSRQYCVKNNPLFGEKLKLMVFADMIRLVGTFYSSVGLQETSWNRTGDWSVEDCSF
ncbi:hypothetical protein GOODEAATRI_003639 [Goodea atripinnis]|uniref:Uncharacterized protein n=1 Tax=Goodea atripinnis TaxID=208336 RepID=A0ABV0PB57_9TELE